MPSQCSRSRRLRLMGLRSILASTKQRWAKLRASRSSKRPPVRLLMRLPSLAVRPTLHTHRGLEMRSIDPKCCAPIIETIGSSRARRLRHDEVGALFSAVSVRASELDIMCERQDIPSVWLDMMLDRLCSFKAELWESPAPKIRDPHVLLSVRQQLPRDTSVVIVFWVDARKCVRRVVVQRGEDVLGELETRGSRVCDRYRGPSSMPLRIAAVDVVGAEAVTVSRPVTVRLYDAAGQETARSTVDEIKWDANSR
jgi:hypothetical protein